jgi:hypothetical protein
MKTRENIEKIVKEFDVDVNIGKDKAILDKLLQRQQEHKTAGWNLLYFDICRSMIRNKAFQLSFAMVFILVSCLLAIVLLDSNESEQNEKIKPVATVTSEKQAGTLNMLELNIAFRDGGMQAVEEQFNKIQKKVKPGLKNRLTVEQLICELDGC